MLFRSVAHEYAESVHKGIEENFALVKHVTVHVNPYKDGQQEETPLQETIDEESAPPQK